LLIAKRTADFVAHGEAAREAAQAAIVLLGARTSGTGGLIVVDQKGNVGLAWNSPNMKHAYMTEATDAPIAGF
jgi:beta-aspartyl-peptidase (threonine type)